MSQHNSTFSPAVQSAAMGVPVALRQSHDETRQFFERSQQRWSQTQEQLANAMRARTTSPLSPAEQRQNDNEIADLRRQLNEIKVEMDNYRIALQNAESTIRQQQATIKHQSKIIEKPRSQAAAGSAKPKNGKHGGIKQEARPLFAEATPQLSELALVHLRVTPSPGSIDSTPYHEMTAVSLTNSLASLPFIEQEELVKAAFRKLFDMAQNFANMHTNFISNRGDASLPQETKNRLLSAATQSSAFAIMKDFSTRYLLVAKIMLDWLIKNILKFNAFSGLDTNIDQVVNSAKATIYQSTPAQVKYLILTNIATETKKIRSHPNFGAFVDYISQERAKELHRIVRPLMHPQNSGAWEDLVILLKEAYKVAELMFDGTDEYSFEFPEFGVKFDTTIMINIDPVLGGMDLGKLVKGGATVRLGATPVIGVRRNVAAGTLPPSVVLPAKVLLKKRA